VFSVQNLIEKFGCSKTENFQDPSNDLFSLSSLEDAQKENLSFVASTSYLKKLESTKASLIITHPNLQSTVQTLYQGSILIHDDPYGLMSDLLFEFQKQACLHQTFNPSVHPSAFIHPTASIHPSVQIGPYVVIGAQSVVSENCILESHVEVQKHVRIDSGCHLKKGVFVYDRCVIEKNCFIGENSVLGSEGFGFAHPGNKNQKIPQLGSVWLEESVELGSLTAVDRSTFPNSYTKIGHHTKIDNLVQIGHNVKIGSYCIISGQTGLGGSSQLGDRVICGGQTGVADGCEIASQTVILAKTGVTKSLKKDMYIGFPAEPHLVYKRNLVKMRKLLNQKEGSSNE
jgi:UDP-3-O-[3-hydroxymyristoyl] glucosamine N-acyltransferase